MAKTLDELLAQAEALIPDGAALDEMRDQIEKCRHYKHEALADFQDRVAQRLQVALIAVSLARELLKGEKAT